MIQANPNDFSVGKCVVDHLALVISTAVGIATTSGAVVGFIFASVVRSKDERIAWFQDKLKEAERRVDDLKNIPAGRLPGPTENERHAIKRAASAFSFFGNLWRIFVLGMLIYALYLQTGLLTAINEESQRSSEQQRKTDDAIASLNRRLSGSQGSNSGSSNTRSSAGGTSIRGKGTTNVKVGASTDAKKANEDAQHKSESPTPTPTPAP